MIGDSGEQTRDGSRLRAEDRAEGIDSRRRMTGKEKEWRLTHNGQKKDCHTYSAIGDLNRWLTGKERNI